MKNVRQGMVDAADDCHHILVIGLVATWFHPPRLARRCKSDRSRTAPQERKTPKICGVFIEFYPMFG
jgi:hypothetical protein